MGILFQYSCLENSVNKVWWAAVHGVANSQIWLSTHIHDSFICFILSFFFFFNLQVLWLWNVAVMMREYFKYVLVKKKSCLHCVLSWKQISHWTDDRFPLYIIKQTIFRVTWGFVSLLILLFIIHSINIYEVSLVPEVVLGTWDSAMTKFLLV